MNAVVTLSEKEIDMVSGGNALDTTTGSYVSPQKRDFITDAFMTAITWRTFVVTTAMRPLMRSAGK